MRERKIEKYLVKNPKQMFIVIAVFTLMIFVGGTTYAFFNYTRTGTANTLSVGRISFNHTQDGRINLSDVFPIDKSTINTDTKNVGTFEINIEGDTDYVGGIEYLVSAVNTNITTTTGQIIPISLDINVEGLGTYENNYFTERENKTSKIYKRLTGNGIMGDGNLLVGYIPQNTTLGTPNGIDGTITIKAYIDQDKVAISDTYDGNESDNMGTTNEWVDGRVVLTTDEWNAFQNSGISFQIKVEANEDIWVEETLYDIVERQTVMDNINSEFVNNTTPGIDFSNISSDTNGKGVYTFSSTANDAYPVKYFRGAVDNNNVLFANKCWKMVRTTDTGGVKLIYNGELSPVYTKEFTDPDTYTSENEGDILTFDNTDNTWNYEVSDGSNREISFKVPAGDNYSIVATGTTGSTCVGGLGIYKDGVRVNGTSQGVGNPINYSYTYGTLSSSNVLKIIVNGTNSSTCGITVKMYMQQGTTKLSKNDYSVLMQKNSGESGCDNTGTDTHINISGTNMFAFNTNHNSPAYVGYMYGDVYTYNSGAAVSGAYYGSGFTYSNGTYKLTNPSTTIDNTHHYTCNLTTRDGTCATIRYYYYANSNLNYYNYYINLTGGDGVEEALKKMQTNTNNSNAKAQIDTWYASNMNTVINKLEDTIWCNDRSMGNGNNNGWIANGGDLKTYLDYGATQRSNYASNDSTVKNGPSLACINKNDAFTVSNGNGNQKLTYPVALLTEDEIVLAGGLAGTQNPSFYLNNGSTYYWSLSPFSFTDFNAYEFRVYNGGISYGYVGGASGLRPSVSLKHGTYVTKGTGTVTDPYIID